MQMQRLRMNNKGIIVLGLLLAPALAATAQWRLLPQGAARYHCAECVDVPDILFAPDSVAMEGILGGDITLCNSLGRETLSYIIPTVRNRR